MKLINYLRERIPDSIVRYLYSKFLRRFMVSKAYGFDKKRYMKYSDSFLLRGKNELLGNIIKHYHVLEKGLTMPETRLGFGQKMLLRLIDECEHFIARYGNDECQLQHCLAVIVEYKEFHDTHNFKLPEQSIAAIDRIRVYYNERFISKQKITSRSEFFSKSNSPFDAFSNSRASVRNFSDTQISMDTLSKALDLAMNTPSACNRQSWRSYVFSDKSTIQSILDEQGGNRGFGHLTNKLIVITGELGVFSHSFERNQVFIDGGMYAMNLLYALHFNNIAACILNCSTTPEKDKRLHEMCEVSDSEVFIAMIVCGIPPENFKIASSPRYDLSHIVRYK